METKYIAGGLVGILVVAGSSFYAGMHYVQNQRSQRFAGANGQGQFFQMGPSGRQGGTMANGGFAVGRIVSKDTSGITIQLMQSGAPGSQNVAAQETGSKMILINSSTQIMKTASSSSDELATGENVMIQGTANSDGSITAQSIQIRPAGSMSAPRRQ